jgi:hypothetical protein
MVEPVTGWFVGYIKLMPGDWYRVRNNAASMLDCSPIDEMMEVTASAPEETLILNVESEIHAEISEMLAPTFVAAELENAPKPFPLSFTMKLPVTGARDSAAFVTTGLINEMLTCIDVVCVDGRDITME